MKKYIGCTLLIALLAGCGGEGFYVKKYSEEYARKNLVPVAPAKIYANAKELATEAYGRVDMISVSEYDQLAKSGKPHLLLDIREKKEFEAGAYDNAILLPRGVLEFKIFDPEKWKTVTTERALPSKKEKVVVYCKSGLRSGLAADNLQRLGFTDVALIRGGWEQQKKGIADAGSQPVKREQAPTKIIGEFKSGTEMVAAAKPRCTPLTVADLDAYLAATPNVYLFDIRQGKEYKAGHIDGAILSPRGVFPFHVSIPKKWAKVKTDRPMPGKSDPIVVYCKKGSRSVLAADTLRSLGFTNVRYIEGGWLQYKEGPKVVVDDGGCG
ncbi:MAG: rhodanese-like domain-containing protein [Verrucomicrobiota bacterium]|nr:rhodanese-like domain-containing protein [Verrucomicrobiota bacterium]